MKTCSTFALLPLLALAAQAQSPKVMPLNVANVVGRSDIILARPNKDYSEAVPLGNGRLGAAIWADNGFTVQLNRVDTMPDRLSAGQVVIPGLKTLTEAPDYKGRINLYDGVFEESGGGMTAKAYIQAKSDLLIIEITGADPSKPQTAELHLWNPRTPKAEAKGAIGALTESWVDDKAPGHSGRTFGSVASITADGRQVTASTDSKQSVTVTATPDAKGNLRILIAVPEYQQAAASISKAFASADRSARIIMWKDTHLTAWHNFWHHANLIKVTSQDGAADYMENLRTLYLYYAAAEAGIEYPGSQAGVGDLFSATRDDHQWDPSAFWHWNLRMQIAANMSAGLPELNEPYFRLYRDNLANIEAWTKERMHGAPGICVPETMRFNGQGIEFERWDGNSTKISGLNCAADSVPYYNARTISTGAEVSLWIWQQYLLTSDKAFLATNYPVMKASTEFLLSYEKKGDDGLLHTNPSNAHESQWDVLDPVTDLSARKALYPAVIKAATILGKDTELVAKLKAEIPKIPTFPRVAVDAPKVLLKPGENTANDMISFSYQPEATIHNVENIGLEPVWPYDLIGDTSPDFELAKRTFNARPNKSGIDWSYDPVQATRLHLGSEVSATLLNITQANQHYINGMAKWGGDGKEFYIEQTGNVALALQETLVQDYDGAIRIAPAIPPGWDFDGTVTVRNQVKVSVQTRNGKPTAVGLETPLAGPIQINNPWPGQPVSIRESKTGATILKATADAILKFQAKSNSTYELMPESATGKTSFTPIEATPATTPKKQGKVQIGLDK
jgi:alpha-L-fucosidase 2